MGASLYKREDSLFFRRSHFAARAQFLRKIWRKTVILARFVPIVRTFWSSGCRRGGNAVLAILCVRYFWRNLWVAARSGRLSAGPLNSEYRAKNSLRNWRVIVLSLLPAVISIWRERQTVEEHFAAKTRAYRRNLKHLIPPETGPFEIQKNTRAIILTSDACWCAWILPGRWAGWPKRFRFAAGNLGGHRA